MDPVTFSYCDTSSPIRYVQVTNVHPPLKVVRFVTVIGRPPFFTWIVTGRPLLLLSEMWTFCHRSPGVPPGSLLACFTGGGQNVTMVKITVGKTAKSHRSFQTSGRIGKIIKKTLPLNTPCQISVSRISVWRSKS